MSTMEVLGVGYRAAKAAARQRRAERRSQTRSGHLAGAVKQHLAEHGLSVLAGGCFTAAAIMVAIPLGLAVAGVALLVLELRVGER